MESKICLVPHFKSKEQFFEKMVFLTQVHIKRYNFLAIVEGFDFYKINI